MTKAQMYMIGATSHFVGGILLLTFAHDGLGWWSLGLFLMYLYLANLEPDSTDEVMMRIYDGES